MAGIKKKWFKSLHAMSYVKWGDCKKIKIKNKQTNKQTKKQISTCAFQFNY